MVIVAALISLLVGVGIGTAIPTSQSGEVSQLRARVASLEEELKQQKTEVGIKQSLLNVNAKITIPLQKGLFNGQDVFYISTEASDKETADLISKKTGFPVTVAPALEAIPASALANFFVFTNGVKGDGINGFQAEVFDTIPGDKGYSPAWRTNVVEWVDPSQATVLKSVQEVVEARQAGKVGIRTEGGIVNCPFVKWPGGQLPTFEGVHDDNSPYGQAQVLSIDTNNMQVVFRAHRGWAQDGSQIAYIVTDASLADPAKDMGVAHVEITQNILNTAAASDLWQFTNGIPGSGPMGFQAGIGVSKPGDAEYSPFWSIQAITWNDPSKAVILESKADIDLAGKRGLIKLEAMMGGMIVNCPFVPIELIE